MRPFVKCCMCMILSHWVSIRIPEEPCLYHLNLLVNFIQSSWKIPAPATTTKRNSKKEKNSVPLSSYSKTNKQNYPDVIWSHHAVALSELVIAFCTREWTAVATLSWYSNNLCESFLHCRGLDPMTLTILSNSIVLRFCEWKETQVQSPHEDPLMLNRHYTVESVNQILEWGNLLSANC